MALDHVKSALVRPLQYFHLQPYLLSTPTCSTTDIIWLFDTTAFPTQDGASSSEPWTSEFLACFLAEDRLRDSAGKAITQIAQEVGLAPNDEAARHTIESRIWPFLASVLPGKALSVRLSDGGDSGEQSGEVLELHKSDKSGISATKASFGGSGKGVSAREGEVVKGVAIIEPREGVSNEKVELEMDVYCASTGGWGVISDIDDTIKISQVRDRVALLRNTFVNDPEPTPGFPNFYEALQTRLNSPSYIYLSASPYNLYAFLRPFIRAHFPHGQIMLRDMSWMDLSSFVLSLTAGTQKYKAEQMEKLHQWLPGKKWVAIGDSTQTDPEAYAEIYKRYPGWIQRIWIRTVRGVNPEKEKELNSEKRFRKAFEGVPEYVWRTFDDVGELYAELEKIEL